MVDHYFSKVPTSRHDERIVEAVLRGKKLKFVTDTGVFSRSGVDYGSQFLIERMDIPDGARVLDIGCGYGPIGIMAAKLHPDNRVVMADINERAVMLARRNAELNGATNTRILQSDIYEQIEDREFDVILSNPPIRAGKKVVFAIFEGARELLKDGGSLWVVIQKKQGAPSALEKLKQLYGRVEEVGKSKGYRVFRAIKMDSAEK